MKDVARAIGAIALLLLCVFVFSPWLMTKLRKSPTETRYEPDVANTSLEAVDDLQSEAMTKVVIRLAERVGVEPDDVSRHLVAFGIAKPIQGAFVTREAGHERSDNPATALLPVDLSRCPTTADLISAIENGLHVARHNDDYRQCGLEYDLDDAPVEYEVELLDQSLRDQAEMASKLSIAAVELLRRHECPGTEREMTQMARELTWVVDDLQKAMRQRVTIRLSELGSRRDRQLFDFQVGVVNYLREHGLLPELTALYRAGTTEAALDYPLEWALGVLRQKCPSLALLERQEIEHLLAAPIDELRQELQTALPVSSKSEAPERDKGPA